MSLERHYTDDTGALNYKHCNMLTYVLGLDPHCLGWYKEVWTNLCESCCGLASRFRSVDVKGRQVMASLHCVRGGKHRCLIDVWTRQGLLSTVWIVCQTQMVFDVKGTHSWIQSPSLQLSLTPVRTRMISLTKPYGLIWQIVIMFCLWSVIVWDPLLRAILETCYLWDICSEWWGDMTWPRKTYLSEDFPKISPTNLSTYLPTYLPMYLLYLTGICDTWDTDYNTDNWEPG